MTEMRQSDCRISNPHFIPKRGLTEKTLQFWNIVSSCNTQDTPVCDHFFYSENYIKRRYLNKTFDVVKLTDKDEYLYGKYLFSAGSAEAITICEGEYDAASIWQMLGSKYPVVSVRSSSTAESDIRNEYDYINSFKKIYLCLDNDKPGNTATQNIARLFEHSKIYYVKLSKFKDANEYLTNNAAEEFRRVWWNSTVYVPEGIVSTNADFSSIFREESNKQGIPYPWLSWNEKLFGIRSGEVVLITALEGVGKTEIVRNIEYQLLKETDDNIGVIHLEESKKRTLDGYVGLEMRTPIHLPNYEIPVERKEEHLFKLLKRDNRLHLYTHFGSEDPKQFVEKLRYLVAVAKCKWIIIDHISMLVSGLGEDKERILLDYLSTQFAMLVNKYEFGMVLVSHVNDNDQTRGSRNISKIANIHIHMSRDQVSSDPARQNTTDLVVKKNRFSGMTGPLKSLVFNRNEYTLSESSQTTNMDQRILATPTPVDDSWISRPAIRSSSTQPRRPVYALEPDPPDEESF